MRRRAINIGSIIIAFLFAVVWILRPSDLRSILSREGFHFNRSRNPDGKILYSLPKQEASRFDNLMAQEGFSITIFDGIQTSLIEHARDRKIFGFFPKHEVITSYASKNKGEVGYEFSPEIDPP